MMRRTATAALAMLVALIAPARVSAGEPAADYLKGKSIRVVIGSTAVAGDTYVTAEVVTRHVSQKYGCNIKCDPIGSGRAMEEVVSTRPDGRTVMIFHDSTYLSVLFGAMDANDYKLENMVVGPTYAFNPGDSFAATASAPYKTVAEMAEWMSKNPDQVVRLAVEAGGVSQLGFNGIYEWVKGKYGDKVASRLKVYVTGATDQKLQALWDGNCQAAYGATTVFEEYTLGGVDAKLKLNIIGLMSPNRIKGKDWPTFAEQGITMDGKPFGFTKEYSFFYPRQIPQEFVAAMDAALREVCTSKAYIADMEKVGYQPQFLDSKDNTAHMYAKRAAFKKLIENAPNFDDLTD